MDEMDKDYDVEKFILYDAKTNIGKCSVPECNAVFIGENKLAIKRHYRVAHNTNVEEYDNIVGVFSNHTIIHNDAEELMAPVGYSIKYLKDKSKETVEDKGYRTFLVADYVDYCIKTNNSKCLLKSCKRAMSGRRTGNIKRHYHRVHNFIIVHDNPNIIRAMQKELSWYYNTDTYGDGIFEDNDEISDLSEHDSSASINFDQYIQYDPLINKSICKVPSCKTFLEGRNPYSIKRHFGLVHNYDVESNGSKPYDSTNSKLFNSAALQNTYIISVEDLVMFDIKSSSYQCLFLNCNEILEKHLPTLKRHYHEKHKIIIAKSAESIPHSLYRKRKNYERHNHYKKQFSTANDEYVDETESCIIKNELLSDDEEPHCSKRSKNNSSGMREIEESYIALKENAMEDSHPKLARIQMTKLEFLKLCLDLVIERGIKINLFDDKILFKKLLAPFEESFGFEVNSTLLENLMIKANDSIITNLKEMFVNKILCLELYVLKDKNQYYLIFNIRFLSHQICNIRIGFLGIPESETDIIPIYDYLNKFNIDKQQIYVTTISTSDDEEINQICNNLRKNNCNITNNPICFIKTILGSFVQKYSKDIKCWQELSNFVCNVNLDVFSNLKEFANHTEKLSQMESGLTPELKEAQDFLKSFKIFNNFMEKLNEEQYVTGDLYRDLLCCELELKGELTRNNNLYAGKLHADLLECKNKLLDCSEFLAALYLDVRFNCLGSHLLSEAQKTKGKLYLCTIWERFKKYIESANNNVDPLLTQKDNEASNDDDEYALLYQHINDNMAAKSSVCIEDMIINCIPTKREPFSHDILKYWNCKRKDMTDINELSKIAFTFSSSGYISNYLQNNFAISDGDFDKFDKFLIKNNQNVIEKNIDLITKTLY